jgi:hypothetical protein
MRFHGNHSIFFADGFRVAAHRPRHRRHEDELLHVPRAGRAALGSQGRSAGRPSSSFTITRSVFSGLLTYRSWVGVPAGACSRRADRLLAVVGEADAVHRADVDAGVALDALLVG